MSKAERYPAFVEIIDAEQNKVKARYGRLSVCQVPYGWSEAVGICNGPDTQYSPITHGCRCNKMAYYFEVPDTEVDLNAYALPSTAENVWLSSTNESDIQTISLCMLDENWDMFREKVTLQGTTPVAVSKPVMRINSMSVFVGIEAVGTIAVKTATDITLRAIEPTNTRAFSSSFTVPRGKIAHIVRWVAIFQKMENNKEVIGYCTLRAKTTNCNETSEYYITKDGVIASNEVVNREFTYPFSINEKCDIKMSARRMFGAGKLMVAGSYEILLLDKKAELS